MAKVKIFLDKDENIHDVENDLLKALGHHSSGEIHDLESFEDPAMVDVSNKMEREHSKMFQDMINEIFLTLDEDYVK